MPAAFKFLGFGIALGVFVIVSYIAFDIYDDRNRHGLNNMRHVGIESMEQDMLSNFASPSMQSSTYKKLSSTPRLAEDISTHWSDLESFEMTRYNASIEAKSHTKFCNTFHELKSRTEVVFTNSSFSRLNCNFSFKVEKNYIAEIVDIIEEMNPKEFSQNTHTIKQALTDIATEEVFLTAQLDSVTSTLAEAKESYDEISGVAIANGDSQSLTKIIDSKLSMIEKLTNQSITLSRQLQQISQRQQDSLDHLEYVYFQVNVYQNNFINKTEIVDSWKSSMRDMVRNMNTIAQDLSVNLFVFLLSIMKYLIYSFVVVFTVKYGWKAAKKIWNT